MERKRFAYEKTGNVNFGGKYAGLFSRRGYNIDSFSAGVTADPRFTRITIVTSGDELILEQIEKQLAKLEDVVDIKILQPGASVTRELMLVKISAKDTGRQSVLSITEIFHGKVVDVTHDSMVIEVTGHQEKLQSFFGHAGRLRDPGTCENRTDRTDKRLQGRGHHRLKGGKKDVTGSKNFLSG